MTRNYDGIAAFYYHQECYEAPGVRLIVYHSSATIVRRARGMTGGGQHDQQSMMGFEAIWQRILEKLSMAFASQIRRNEMKRFWSM